MKYIFKYRRKWFWKKIKNVKGHDYNKENDWMIIYFDEGLRTIKKWSDCELELGSDWFRSQLKKAEQKAGQPIPIETED